MLNSDLALDATRWLLNLLQIAERSGRKWKSQMIGLIVSDDLRRRISTQFTWAPDGTIPYFWNSIDNPDVMYNISKL